MSIKSDNTYFEIVVLWFCKVTGWVIAGFVAISSLLLVVWFILHVLIPAILQLFS